jgi:TorA maturation chaperone TorD
MYVRGYSGEQRGIPAAVSLARAETEFLERHLLNWLPAAKAKLDRTTAPSFPVLMTMLVQFLKHMPKSG